MALWNEPAVFLQTFEVYAEREVFNLDFPYRKGMGELTVYYNGIFAVPGETGDYQEVNSRTIKFNFMCQEGDVVICRIQRQG